MTVMAVEAISQRDLRLRSKDIMDAVERGLTYTVTRDGRPMGQLIPLRRRFVTREQFAAAVRGAAGVDLARFRADQESSLEPLMDDPYER
ncbi:MAG: type II toxin-antitoxin system prevent-host-death family antitoxin [Propionibacteriaceae bacterium]|jgi:prevent-host-death family protein|nr:type II toxin-antitoxin system prevent-host-death family antitoxin [Propionibacteriaceae bacterium]